VVFGFPDRLVRDVTDSDERLWVATYRRNPEQIALERSGCVAVEFDGQRMTKAREVQPETLAASSGTDLHCG
jgi:hypothetical protein